MNRELKIKLADMIVGRLDEITWTKNSFLSVQSGGGFIDGKSVVITPLGLSFDKTVVGLLEEIPDQVMAIWEHAEAQFLADAIESLGGVGVPNQEMN